MAQLKYMGFISATRQSTFLFKKNIYGKPKYYSTSVNESELMQSNDLQQLQMQQ